MFSVHDVFLEQLKKYSYSVYLYKQKNGSKPKV